MTPPARAVQLAREIVARERRGVRPGDVEQLAASRPGRVYRLTFTTATGPVAIVAKRHLPRRARANRLVAARWMPAVGLNAICPAVRGVCIEPGSAAVWQLYEDLPGEGMEHHEFDPARVSAVVELLAEVHGRFSGHALLDECRAHGDDLGIAFFTSQLERCIWNLSGIGSSDLRLSAEQRDLIDRFRDRLDTLYRGWQARLAIVRDSERVVTLLHGDLWTSNTLVLAHDGGFAARLIDWDHVGVGPATYDLSTFLYRFPAEHRPWIVARYRDAVARQGLRLPDDSSLNVLFETAEYGRYGWCLAEAAVAARRGEAWALEDMAQIETWFAQLEAAGPALEVR